METFRFTSRLRVWREMPCGHLFDADKEPPDECPDCEHLAPFMEELLICRAIARAIRSVG